MLLPTLQATGAVIDWVENADGLHPKNFKSTTALVLSLASDKSTLNKVLSEKFPNQHHIFAVPSNGLAVGEDFTNIT